MSLLGAIIAKLLIYKYIITLVILFINKQALKFNTINSKSNSLGFNV